MEGGSGPLSFWEDKCVQAPISYTDSRIRSNLRKNEIRGLQSPLRGVIYFGRRGERPAPHGEREGFESFSKTTLDRAQRDTVEYPLAAESGTRRGRGNLDNRILWMVSELTSTVRE